MPWYIHVHVYADIKLQGCESEQVWSSLHVELLYIKQTL